MLNILLCGCGGRMGAAFTAAATAAGDRVIAGIDTNPAAESTYPVYTTPFEFEGKADVIVDFSHHSALAGLLAYAEQTATPIIVCTTGHTEEELAKMKDAAKKTPVFFSRNMSLGINLLLSLCRKAAATLGADFDVEIIEKHHNQKVDAPSGTALMLADAVKSVCDEKFYTYGREGIVGKRDKNEIGIHAVRGGGIVGEHDVIFASGFETVTLSHLATDRSVFADGAVKAVLYIKDKKSGLFNMNDVINGK